MRSKTCSKCGIEKPAQAFHKDRRLQSGLCSACIECKQINKRAYYEKNKESIVAKAKVYYEQNKQKLQPARDSWKKKNAEKMAEYQAKSYLKHKEARKKQAAEYRSDNPEKRRALWQNRKAKKLSCGGTLSSGLALKLITLQKGKCACGCKQPLGNDYHLDHIMPLALGGSNTDDNIQLLRKTCNLQKSAKHPVDFMQQRGFLL